MKASKLMYMFVIFRKAVPEELRVIDKNFVAKNDQIQCKYNSTCFGCKFSSWLMGKFDYISLLVRLGRNNQIDSKALRK